MDDWGSHGLPNFGTDPCSSVSQTNTADLPKTLPKIHWLGMAMQECGLEDIKIQCCSCFCSWSLGIKILKTRALHCRSPALMSTIIYPCRINRKKDVCGQIAMIDHKPDIFRPCRWFSKNVLRMYDGLMVIKWSRNSRNMDSRKIAICQGSENMWSKVIRQYPLSGFGTHRRDGQQRASHCRPPTVLFGARVCGHGRWMKCLFIDVYCVYRNV